MGVGGVVVSKATDALIARYSATSSTSEMSPEAALRLAHERMVESEKPFPTGSLLVGAFVLGGVIALLR